MNFDDSNKAIYLQIADRICDLILQGDYPEDERLPSVRECAAAMEVNANTVMRSYERLASAGLITNRRGIGFFVTPGARKGIKRQRNEEVFSAVLPPVFRQLHSLGISPDDLRDEYEQFLKGANLNT